MVSRKKWAIGGVAVLTPLIVWTGAMVALPMLGKAAFDSGSSSSVTRYQWAVDITPGFLEGWQAPYNLGTAQLAHDRQDAGVANLELALRRVRRAERTQGQIANTGGPECKVRANPASSGCRRRSTRSSRAHPLRRTKTSRSARRRRRKKRRPRIRTHRRTPAHRRIPAPRRTPARRPIRIPLRAPIRILRLRRTRTRVLHPARYRRTGIPPPRPRRFRVRAPMAGRGNSARKTARRTKRTHDTATRGTANPTGETTSRRDRVSPCDGRTDYAPTERRMNRSVAVKKAVRSGSSRGMRRPLSAPWMSWTVTSRS